MDLHRPEPGERHINRAGWCGRFRQISTLPGLSFLIPFSLVLVGRALLLPWISPPQPLIEDEFSYLLAGETFASFRLTNPPHPLWQHFETIHELMQPTYMSKYPPMQGLCLAFGQIVCGSPWMGVMLTMALFCGLLPWAFRAWIPGTWALAGALLVTWRIGIMSYWTESYWGGGAAAVGGVLVLGSVRRLALQPSAGMAAIFTLGAGILGNSRPYEGMIFLLGSMGYLAWKWFGAGRWRERWPSWLLRIAPAVSLVAMPIVAAMALYNYRVTGKVTEFPYQAFEKQYSVWTPFVWQQRPTAEPIYRHDFIRREWIDWDSLHKTYERKHWLWVHEKNFETVIRFYFGPSFFCGGYLLLGALFFGAKNRAVAGLLVFYYAGSGVLSDVVPHYTAPAAALIYLAAVCAMRTSWRFAPARVPLGKWGSLVFAAIFIITTTISLTGTANRFLYYKPHWIEKRERVMAILNRQPGPQLVFVRHGPLHDVNEVWTFNAPDIDASRIIWVDSMTPVENQAVLDYYRGKRTVWMLDDDAFLTLRRYDSPNLLLKMQNAPPEPPLRL